ncbi:MAG: helix-turn-helix transcriptional regulator [Clostridia bacterium]|nr:helix-turn-helix transcriptional regulator [Clostridia bacterium]
MNLSINSKIYRIKISDTDINVTVDDSYSYPNRFTSSSPISPLKMMHNHAIYEFFFVGDEGLTVFSDNGSKEYKNCIVCIPPLFNHFSTRKSDYRILFSFNSPYNKKTDFSRFMNKLQKTDKPTELKSDENLMFLVNQFSQLTDSHSSVSEEAATCALKLIFYYVFDLNSDIKEKTTADISNSSYLIKIDSLLYDFQKDIKLTTIADVLGLSTKQTSRIIRKNYKMSLSELMKEKRLRTACILLTQSSMPISDIVEYINFPSESSFYSQFKKHYGCTPLAYRKSH